MTFDERSQIFADVATLVTVGMSYYFGGWAYLATLIFGLFSMYLFERFGCK